MVDQLIGQAKPTLVHLVCSSGFYGAERVISNLCQVLPQLRTVVLCLSPVPEKVAGFAEKVRAAGAEFVCVNNRFSDALSALRRIENQYGPVLLHAHGYKEIVVASGYGLIRGSRVVVTQHGFTRRNLKSRVYNWIDKAFCRWANVQRVIAVSQSILDEYLAFAVKPEKMRMLANGVSVSQSAIAERKAARNKLQQHYAIDESTPLVLYAGRLSQEKDPMLFVESMARLFKFVPDGKALIAGDGPLQQLVLQRIQQLGLSDRILCLGFVEHMDQLLPAADLLMVTSETEGSPMCVLEAMAAGVAVIASAVGGLPSLIQDRVDGVLVAPRDAASFAEAARALLEDASGRANMIELAREKITRQFDLRQQSECYLQDIYAVDVPQ